VGQDARGVHVAQHDARHLDEPPCLVVAGRPRRMEHHDRDRAVVEHSDRHRTQDGAGDATSAAGAHAEEVEGLLA
jgi:hypothetical protein